MVMAIETRDAQGTFSGFIEGKSAKLTGLE
jgi:hypothetical protein